MSSQLPTIICIIFGIISWYYFNKFLESEREYSKLHKRFDNLYTENQKMRTRIKDLQSYKTDVSKTFQILDNELVMINDHLKRRTDRGGPLRTNANVGQQATIPTLPISVGDGRGIHTTIQTSRIPLTRISSFANMPTGNNVSLLTPELLTSLFNMNTEDLRQTNTQRAQQQTSESNNIPQAPQAPQAQQQTDESNSIPQSKDEINESNNQQQTLQSPVLHNNVLDVQENQNGFRSRYDDVINNEESNTNNTRDISGDFDGGLEFNIAAGSNSGYEQYLLNN